MIENKIHCCSNCWNHLQQKLDLTSSAQAEENNLIFELFFMHLGCRNGMLFCIKGLHKKQCFVHEEQNVVQWFIRTDNSKSRNRQRYF